MTTTAPTPPGTPGTNTPATELLTYLNDLGHWCQTRRTELDELDATALKTPGSDHLTSDIVLSMTLWQAIHTRYTTITTLWDNGRATEPQRTHITSLIWGTLEDNHTNNSLAISLPEACRLSDTLASSLRANLGLHGPNPAHHNRVHALRTCIERIRDQVHLIPAQHRSDAQNTLINLDRRVVDITNRYSRGADVGGLLPALETDLALTERNLIVAAGTRANTKHAHNAALARREELNTTANEIRALASQAAHTLNTPPRLGIPDPNALGEPPTEPNELANYTAKLDRVAQALEHARNTFTTALSHHQNTLTHATTTAHTAQTLTTPHATEDLTPLLTALETATTTHPADTTRIAALTAAIDAYTTTYTTQDSTTQQGSSR
ncbi:hypothetical protein GZ178_09010 [Dermatophilus congolensis]|uniref:hypothetical protein n=3 Tax=Dermatophilus congolensis TaxID=1863 RepID=UPI001AAE9274|nr:hypothetical protein [Dermatophilus congolensis]MBO3152590.1 hypothetical protein [Dermatophilus congolensis]MBO3160399.1 hypothetical protein [Dermatophilus congolensis]MBO3163875.1 hypothetical protein [Dermatophilus congolensis]MBO3177421.1 hypothetical protein [Dermatophilus congolensis]MBO3184191.1 hypothetical protein [Dermatophilus congolensis]